MLKFDQDFLCGATSCTDNAAGEARIVIPIKLAGQDDFIWAIVDTGATYCVLAPNIAKELGLNLADSPDEIGLRTKWGLITGRLCRVEVRIDTLDEIQNSEGIDLQASFFIPNPDQSWKSDLNFIGLQTFLLEIRFAIDPHPDKMLFYFGGPL